MSLMFDVHEHLTESLLFQICLKTATVMIRSRFAVNKISIKN
jgi:hypothetical protein